MIILTICLFIIPLLVAALFFFIPPRIFMVVPTKALNGKKLEDLVAVVPGKKFFGNNFEFLSLSLETAFEYVRANARKYKRSYLLHTFTTPIYNIITAEDAEHVLSSQLTITKGLIYNIVEAFLGQGLLISAGEKWHFRRKLLTPAFHFNILQQFLEIFKEESDRFIQRVSESLDSGKREICLNDIIPQFTLANVCETALGVKLGDSAEADHYREHVDLLEELLIKRVFNPWMFSDFLYRVFGDKKKLDKHIHVVRNFSSQIIKQRRESFIEMKEKLNNEHGTKKKQRFAMLDTLLAAEYDGQQIGHQGICEEVDTFMFEGYDTTSVGIKFTLLMLGIHQDIQDKVFKEITSLTDSILHLDASEINQMRLLDCVVKESLRLYPPVPLISRQLLEETQLGDLMFPALTQILLHIYDIHRDPKYFPDPEKFDPDRFLPENTVNRHPFAFLPFSAGPRNCIGQRFALLEMKTLLINILLRYQLHSLTKREDIAFDGGILLRTKTPLIVRFEKRGR